jgi:hypothetical protein
MFVFGKGPYIDCLVEVFGEIAAEVNIFMEKALRGADILLLGCRRKPGF